MEKREDIRNEISQISEVVAAIGNTNTYAIPPGYFAYLPDTILKAIKQEFQLPVLQSPLPQPPAGYFENLADNILSKIKNEDAVADAIAEELQVVAPLLNTISRQNVYTVPANYFADLKVDVKVSATPAKVIALPATKHRSFGYTIAAAVVAGVAVVGALLFTQPGNNTVKPVNVSQSISALNDAEIVRFLNSEPNVDIVGTSNEMIPAKLSDMKTLLNTVSDEEIQQYLRTDNESDIKPIKGI